MLNPTIRLGEGGFDVLLVNTSELFQTGFDGDDVEAEQALRMAETMVD